MTDEDDIPTAVIFAPEWVGQVDVTSGELQIGSLTVSGVDGGYPQANVYVQRLGADWKPGFPVAKIIIEIIGDGTAQAELDAQNAEAELHPLGPKAYWASHGVDWDDDED